MQTAGLLAVGTAVGLLMSFASGQFFSQILYGVNAHDPLTYLGAIALMTVVAFVACWLPAPRAIRVDPLKALRTE
jgi:putative ABC transport system permease protein